MYVFRKEINFITDRPLIVSYSYSGNTQRIARELQRITGGDWCEIYPWQPYPMAFPELLEQAKQEIQSRYHPRLLPCSKSPRPYQVIFAGSPNWCGTIAPPLASWLSRNDLSGKVIFPFYSHCGGVSCDFKRDISRLCPKATVYQDLSVIDSGGDDLQEILERWLEKKDLMKQWNISGREKADKLKA